MISFTKKIVEELRERCDVEGVEIRTFHSLGNNLLKYADDNITGSRRMIQNTDEVLEQIIANLLEQDEVWRYILYCFSLPSDPAKLSDEHARVLYNRISLTRTLRQETETRGMIRNKPEQVIAYWLYLHGYDFKVREKISDEVDYRPNFTVFLNNQRIYVDLLDIDERGKTWRGKNYAKNVKWRQQYHAEHKNSYIALKNIWWRSGIMIKMLMQKMSDFNKNLKLIEKSKILHFIKTGEEYEKFVKICKTFMFLYKNELSSIMAIKQKIANNPDEFFRYRASGFLKIFEQVAQKYSEYLDANRLYDFSDMINLATEAVREVPECAASYRYILLDEVQDISKNRIELIRAILAKNPSCKLFAVGDDWQSIYRFTGSSLKVILDFDQVFDIKTKRSLIEATHRFGKDTVRVSSDFIKRNPLQVNKKIHTSVKRPTPISILLNKQNSDAESFIKIMKILEHEYGEELKSKSIQVVSRFNRDIERLSHPEIIIKESSIKWRNYSMEFCSMHKSKGITRDIVIILNMNDDLRGMPAQRENDPILNLLLSGAEDFPYAEERRLFYVAITRAREHTFIIANRKNPSPFLFEISDELQEDLSAHRCPRCGFGELIKKHGKRGDFYYCSNYLYDCDYKKRI